MEFVRWYSWPILLGFIFSVFLNPPVAVIGFLAWLALVGYALKRHLDNPEH